MNTDGDSLPFFDGNEIPVVETSVVSYRNLEPLLTIRQVATILKLSPEAVRIEIKKNKIMASRVGPKGGILRIHPDWLIDYIEKRKNFS
jgi:hypothetical protein